VTHTDFALLWCHNVFFCLEINFLERELKFVILRAKPGAIQYLVEWPFNCPLLPFWASKIFGRAASYILYIAGIQIKATYHVEINLSMQIMETSI
jgi:hypothetical protein